MTEMNLRNSEMDRKSFMLPTSIFINLLIFEACGLYVVFVVKSCFNHVCLSFSIVGAVCRVWPHEESSSSL